MHGSDDHSNHSRSGSRVTDEYEEDDYELYADEDEESENDEDAESENINLRDREKALAECPIRTRYVPREVREAAARERARRAHKKKSRALEEHLGNVGVFLKKRKEDLKLLQGTAKDVVSTAIETLSGDAELRLRMEFYQMRAKAAREDHNNLGLSKTEIEEELKKRRTKEVKESCGVETDESKARSQYDDMINKGRCYCGAGQDKSAASQGDEAMNPELVSEKLRREEVRELLHRLDILKKSAGHTVQATWKHSVDFKVMEEICHKNQGGKTNRQDAAEHEVGFDISDGRIYLPRWIRGGCAGQLLSVIPELNDKGTRGNVKLIVNAPKRAALASEPARIEEILDLDSLDIAEKIVDEESPSLRYQGHLHVPRRPISLKEWAERNGGAQNVRRRNEEGPSPTSSPKLDALRRKHGPSPTRKISDDREKLKGEESSDEEEEVGDLAASAKSPSAKSPGSPTSRSPRSPTSLASPGRMQHRGALQDFHLGADTTEFQPWDAREQPHGDELEALFERAKFRVPDQCYVTLHHEGHGHGHGHHDHADGSPQHGGHDDSQEAKEHHFKLKSTSANPGHVVEIDFWIAEGIPPLIEPPRIGEEDGFWDDFFRPLPKNKKTTGPRCLDRCI